MRAMILKAVQQPLELADLPVPQPGPDGVLLRVLSFFEHTRPLEAVLQSYAGTPTISGS